MLAVAETTAGVLILVPRFRKWGAWLASLLLLVFMVYIGIRYNALIGRDCSCFPWVKRTRWAGIFYRRCGFLNCRSDGWNLGEACTKYS